MKCSASATRHSPADNQRFAAARAARNADFTTSATLTVIQTEKVPRAHICASSLACISRRQRDTGHRLRLLDRALHLLSFRMPRDHTSLLVADPLLAQRTPQQRDSIKAALERDALRDRALGHSQPLLAVMAEVSEPERLPGAARLEQHRHVPEHLVPAAAPLHESLELRVDAPGIDLAAELLRLERVDRREASPLATLLLQPFLGRLEIFLGSEQHVIGVLVGRRCVRAEAFLCPGIDPLHLRCGGTDSDSGEPQPFVRPAASRARSPRRGSPIPPPRPVRATPSLWP